MCWFLTLKLSHGPIHGEGESEPALGHGGCWNWTQSPACDTPGVQSYLLVGSVSPCGGTEGTWAQGVSTVTGPAAGKRGIFPLPDQDRITYFTLILQTVNLLFAYSAEKDLKILQSWQKKDKKPGDVVPAVSSGCLGGDPGEFWFPGVTETNESYLLRLMVQGRKIHITCLNWVTGRRGVRYTHIYNPDFISKLLHNELVHSNLPILFHG